MFLDIAILITSTFAFVVWLAVLILYSKEGKQLKEENKKLRLEAEITSRKKATDDAVNFLVENNIQPAYNGLYSHEQIQAAMCIKALGIKKPDGGNE